ncbi:MAG: GGDEF domain-containing protein [Solirubrobacterales bacterium]
MAKRNASDAERTHPNREQALPDPDRESADAASPGGGNGDRASDWERVYLAARAKRLAGAFERKPDSQSPVKVVEEHARESTQHDELAWQRDLAAEARDRAAEQRDLETTEREKLMRATRPSVDAAAGLVSALRAEAATDRAHAADDRRQATLDRLRAAEVREEALGALQEAELDDLTGVYRRGVGEHALRSEIERVHRSGAPLVIAIIDVDGLKEVNDEHGHRAGDELLCDLVAAIQAHVRAYEPIVRLGGDEFAFTIVGLDLEGAESRISEIRDDLMERPSEGSFAVGLAELHPADRLVDLIERADQALVAARR